MRPKPDDPKAVEGIRPEDKDKFQWLPPTAEADFDWLPAPGSTALVTTRDATRSRVEGATTTTAESVSGEVITPEHKAHLQRRLIADLNAAANAEAKIDLLAAFLDRYGFDVLVSAVPHVGDGAMTGIAVLITFWQGLRAGVGFKPGAKIAGYHLADFLVGQIPVIGHFIDLLSKPNEYAAGEFAHRLRELLDEARAKGVPEEEIAEVLSQAEELRARWNGRMLLLEGGREKILAVLGIKDKPRIKGKEGTKKTPDLSPESARKALIKKTVKDRLIYADIVEHLDEVNAQRGREKIAEVEGGTISKSERDYAAALLELFAENERGVLALSQRIRRSFDTLMQRCGFGGSFNPYSLSATWSLWDIAKQHHYFQNGVIEPGYHVGDPLRDERVVQDIIDRHFGWELHGKWRSGGAKQEIILEKISGTPQASEAVALLAKPGKASNGTLSSSELTRLGALVRECLFARGASAATGAGAPGPTAT